MFAKHIQHIIDAHQNALSTRLDWEEVDLTVEQAISVFLEADPTANKSLVDWSVQSYIRDGFLWEDIEQGRASKVYRTLLAYSQNYKKLAVDQRNIYDYASLGSVYTVICDFIEQVKTVSNREVKRAEREKAREETEIIYRDEETIIAVPRTEYAAVWWGKGTQWCTAADNNNQFARYYQTAPLIVINLLPVENARSIAEQTNRKLQLWIPRVENHTESKNNYQFMDENDQNVTKDFIEENWHRLDKILEWAVHINGHLLALIPEQFRTYQLCSVAIESNWQSVIDVPSYLENAQDLYTRAVTINPLSFRYVPDTAKTADFIAKICCLMQIPLMYLPYEFRTFEICKRAVVVDPDELRFVPKTLINEDICWISILRSGEMLNYVPDAVKTFDLCRAAVEQNAKALRFVPGNYLNRDLWKIALASGKNILYTIPVEKWDDEIIRIAVEHNGMQLNNIPLETRTPEICRLAVEQTGYAIRYVPLEYRKELYTKCVEQSGLALECIPETDITQNLCWAAVRENPHTIKNVPYRFLSDEIVDFALDRDPDSFYQITPSMRTYKRCQKLCGIRGTYLRLVPSDLKDMALCRLAVETDGMALMFVPKEFKTKELCRIAYKQAPNAFRFFPKDLVQEAFTNPKWHIDYIAELKSHWIDNNESALKP